MKILIGEYAAQSCPPDQHSLENRTKIPAPQQTMPPNRATTTFAQFGRKYCQGEALVPRGALDTC